ncbi:MAG: hypothetical protein RL095_1608 [Verrucomicrobiota bacterium]|jgi:hypothetical protein
MLGRDCCENRQKPRRIGRLPEEVDDFRGEGIQPLFVMANIDLVRSGGIKN